MHVYEIGLNCEKTKQTEWLIQINIHIFKSLCVKLSCSNHRTINCSIRP